MTVQSASPESGEAADSATATPLQVRGRSFTAVVVRLTGPADDAFFKSLEALMRQAPHFFVNAPLVVDLEQAEDLETKADFIELARQLRARRLSPVGVQNARPEQGVAAFAAGLTTLQGGRDVSLERGPRPVPQPAPEAAKPAKADAPDVEATDAPAAEAAELEGPATLIVTEPVRSGQRIFAERGDLIVMAAVSSGAELMAHGNIHVYGPLRGRALAGVNGDRTARIFCQSLEAELIAIAGLYRMSDDIDAALARQRVQAFLQDDALRIEPLK